MFTNNLERMGAPRGAARVVKARRGKSSAAGRMVTLERRAARALKYGGRA